MQHLQLFAIWLHDWVGEKWGSLDSLILFAYSFMNFFCILFLAVNMLPNPLSIFFLAWQSSPLFPLIIIMQHCKLRGGFKAFLLIQVYLILPYFCFITDVEADERTVRTYLKLVKEGKSPEIPVPFLSSNRRVRRSATDPSTSINTNPKSMNTTAPNSADRPRQTKNLKGKGNKVLFVSFSNSKCTCTLKHLSLNGSYIIALVPDILCSFALTLYKPITLLHRHLLLVPMKCGKKNSLLSQRASCNYVL